MNSTINSFSKEAIKVRMLQNAVKIWGLKSISSIDPFVSLLIDAFSTEIFKANNEIQATNSRIVEKLAKLLTPSIFTYPQPAHAIAQAYPNAAIDILPSHSEFFVKRQFPSTVKSVSDVQMDIHFTPIDHVRLVKMSTVALITASTCYLFDEDQNKIPISKVESNIKYNKIFLGIDATDFDEVKFPQSLALYCSNPTFEYIDFVFKLLPFINISNRGNELSVKAGLNYEKSNSTSGYEEIFIEYSMQKRIEENIKNIYKDKFIEIFGLNRNSITEIVPEAIAFIQEKKELWNLLQGKKMIWLEMTFPPQYTTEILDNFSFSLNAFPIFNRKWKSNEFVLDMMGDNIPLATNIGEHFLYVDKVVDSHGNIYTEIPFHNNSDLRDKGLFTIRKGGMERFNDRNALDMISNVLELTRDEVSAFGVLERDKVIEALTNMTTQMKILQQRVSNADKELLQEVNYVIVNPYENIEHLRATYWVSNCSLANNIRSETVLTQLKIRAIKIIQNIKLLTSTVGGSEEQKGTNAIEAYKYALTTRDKLITIEDIKNFCYLMLKDDLESVEVKRVTIISTKPKEGFVRAIEVEIIPNNYNHLGRKYWENISATLKHQIMLRGNDAIEYIVKIKNRHE